jgi:osmotically-inducible protein OsmY
MFNRIVAVASALVAVGCGGAENQPARDSTSVTATAPAKANRASSSAMSGPAVTAETASTETAASVVPRKEPNTAAADVSSTTPPTDVARPAGADPTPSADNTRINERDRHDTLTPMDQGGSRSETAITAAIRRAMMGDKSLSFTAKNVKVITIGSKVTLRGPVGSEQERATIEVLAKRTAGVSDIDNQIEVKK